METLYITPQPELEEIVVSVAVCEGRDPHVIDALARVIEQSPAITLINVDPNRFLNQSFYLYCGPVETVLEATLNMLQVAVSKIDLGKFQGESPPIGVIDHLSLVPLQSGLLPQAVRLARRLADKIHQTLKLPVFFFAENARSIQRRDIRAFRELDYKNLPALWENREQLPDLYNPDHPNRSGAIIMGARLYQVNIAFCFDLEHIDEVRELLKFAPKLLPDWDYIQRRLESEQVRPFTRRPVHKFLKHAHFVIDDVSRVTMVRVLCNIPDFREMPLPLLCEIVRHMAVELNAGIIGSQLLGYLPAEVLIRAGEFLVNNGDLAEYEALQLMSYAVDYLRMDAVDPFILDRRVLDYYCRPER